MGEPRTIRVINLPFPAARQKTNRTRIAFEVPNYRACYVFFRHALGFFFFRANLHERRSDLVMPAARAACGFLSGST